MSVIVDTILATMWLIQNVNLKFIHHYLKLKNYTAAMFITYFRFSPNKLL